MDVKPICYCLVLQSVLRLCTLSLSLSLSVYVCVCGRERERKRERLEKLFSIIVRTIHLDKKGPWCRDTCTI